MRNDHKTEDLFVKCLNSHPNAHHLELFCRFESYFKYIPESKCGAGSPENNRQCFDTSCCWGELQIKATAYNTAQMLEMELYITPYMFHVYSDDLVQWMITSGNVGVVGSDSYIILDGQITLYDPELTILPYKFEDVFV